VVGGISVTVTVGLEDRIEKIKNTAIDVPVKYVSQGGPPAPGGPGGRGGGPTVTKEQQAALQNTSAILAKNQQRTAKLSGRVATEFREVVRAAGELKRALNSVTAPKTAGTRSTAASSISGIGKAEKSFNKAQRAVRSQEIFSNNLAAVNASAAKEVQNLAKTAKSRKDFITGLNDIDKKYGITDQKRLTRNVGHLTQSQASSVITGDQRARQSKQAEITKKVARENASQMSALQETNRSAAAEAQRKQSAVAAKVRQENQRELDNVRKANAAKAQQQQQQQAIISADSKQRKAQYKVEQDRIRQAERARLQARTIQPGGGAGGRGPGGGGGGGGAGSGGYFGSAAKGDRSGGFFGRLKSVGEFSIAAKVFQTGFNAIAKIPQTITEVDTEIKELNKVLATSGKNLDNLRKAAVATGTEFGNSITTVLKGFKVFAQQGLQAQEVVERGRAVALAENVSTLSTEEAAETVTAGLKVYGDQVGGSAERLIDSFVAVESQNAVTAADLAEVVKRVGIAAKNAGTTFDELSGMTTVIQEATRAGGGRISRVLKFTFKNLFDQARQGDLQAIGVSTRTQTGDLRDATDVLGDIAKKWHVLTRAQRRNIAVNIGGTRFQNEFNALMSDFGKVSTVAAQSQGAAGTATERNAIIMQSISKRAAKVGAAFEGFAVAIGDGLTSPITAALTVTEKLLTTLTEIASIKVPGLAGLQGMLGVEESEQRGTVGQLGGALIPALGAVMIGKTLGGAGKAVGGLLGKVGLGMGAGAATGAAAGAATGGAGLGVAAGLGAVFSKLGSTVATVVSKLGIFGRIAAIIGGLLGGKFLALAAVITGTSAVINRFNESAEERAQRTGLNARRDVVGKRVQNFSSIVDAFERSEEERKYNDKNKAKLDQEAFAKNQKVSEVRDKQTQALLREELIRMSDDKGGREVLEKVGVKITKGIGKQQDQFTFQGKDVFASPEFSKKVSKELRKEDAAGKRVLDVQKSMGAFSDFDKFAKSGSASLSKFAEALNASEARVTKFSKFLHKTTGGALGQSDEDVKPTQEQKELLRSEKYQAKFREAISKGVRVPIVSALKEGGLAEFDQLVKDSVGKISRGGTWSRSNFGTLGAQAEEAEQMNLQLLRSMGFGQRGVSPSEVQSRTWKDSPEYQLWSRSQATDDPIDTVGQKQLRHQFFTRRNLELSLGTEIQRITEAVKEGIDTSELKAEDLSVKLTGEDGKLLSGDALVERLREYKPGTTFVQKTDQGLDRYLVKFKDDLLGVGKAGGATKVADLTSEQFHAQIKSGNITVVKAPEIDQDLSKLDRNLALTGFGAGTRLDFDNFQVGAASLEKLSDQQAGTFERFSKSGAVFNRGLQQFLAEASKQQDVLKKELRGRAPSGEDRQRMASLTVVAKAAETFGIAAKSIEAASENFRRFQEARAAREEAPVSMAEALLMPGGFESLQLGRSISELNPLELAQMQNRPEARRFADLQQGQRLSQKVIASEGEAIAAFNKMIESLPNDVIKNINPDEFQRVLTDRPEGFNVGSTEDLAKAVERSTERLTEGAGTTTVEDLKGAVEEGVKSRTAAERKLVQERKPELLKLDQMFRVQKAFNSVAVFAQKAEQSFQNVSESSRNIEEALTTPFKAQGAQAERLFTGKPGQSVDQLAQVQGLERLNRFERERKVATLLSSKAVREGRMNVYDERRQRMSPISKKEAAARIRDSRLNEQRAKKMEKQREQEKLFTARKGQLDQVLGQVRQAQQLDLGEGFKKALSKIEDSLVNIQGRRPESFFSRGGRFKESNFQSLVNVSSTLQKELKSMGMDVKDLPKAGGLNADQILDSQKVLGNKVTSGLISGLGEKGALTEEQIQKALAQGAVTEDQAQQFRNALNTQKFSPIVTKLDLIASLIKEQNTKKQDTTAADAKKGYHPVLAPGTLKREHLAQQAKTQQTKTEAEVKAVEKVQTNVKPSKFMSSETYVPSDEALTKRKATGRDIPILGPTYPELSQGRGAVPTMDDGVTLDLNKFKKENLAFLRASSLDSVNTQGPLTEVEQKAVDSRMYKAGAPFKQPTGVPYEAAVRSVRNPSFFLDKNKDKSDVPAMKVSQKMDEASKSLTNLKSVATVATDTQSTSRQAASNEQKKIQKDLHDISQSSKLTSEIADKTKRPANTAQTDESKEVIIANLDAITTAVKDGAEAGVTAGANSIGEAVSSAVGGTGIGGQASDLQDRLEAFLSQEAPKVAQLEQEAAALSQEFAETQAEVTGLSNLVVTTAANVETSKAELEKTINDKVEEVNEKIFNISSEASSDTTFRDSIRDSLTAVNERINQLQTSVEESQPLEEDRTAQADAKGESALAQVADIRANLERLDGHVRGLEGRVASV
jgi:TP901 family phage tail tape measure protein